MLFIRNAILGHEDFDQVIGIYINHYPETCHYKFTMAKGEDVIKKMPPSENLTQTFLAQMADNEVHILERK